MAVGYSIFTFGSMQSAHSAVKLVLSKEKDAKYSAFQTGYLVFVNRSTVFYYMVKEEGDS